MRMITGSRLTLASNCLHWVKYDDNDLAEQRLKAATEEGTIHHEAAEQEGTEEGSGAVREAITEFLANGQPAPRVNNEKTKRRFEGWKKNWPLYCPPGEVIYEAAFSYDYRTSFVKFLGTNIGRKYPEDNELVCCSLDVISYDPSTKTVYVVDHKTGLKATPCEDNWQMIFGSICAFDYYSTHEVKPEKIIAQLHYIDENGNIEVDEAEFDYFSIASYNHQLYNIAKKSNLEPNPGDHCLSLYCDSVAVCPATRKKAEQIVPVQDLLAKIKSPEQLNKAREAVEYATTIIEKVNEACKTYCDENGGEVLLPNGKTYKRVKVNKASFSKSKAVSLLGEKKAAECYVPSSYYMYKAVGGPRAKSDKPRKPRTKKLKENN